MENSERDILSKIGDTLIEINEDYENLQQESDSGSDAINLYLLTAKTKQLTAYLEVLEKTRSIASLVGAQADVSVAVEQANDVMPFGVDLRAQEESDSEPVEQVENVPEEYQHGNQEPKMQEVEDVEEFVPEVKQELEPEEELESETTYEHQEEEPNIEDEYISEEEVENVEEIAEVKEVTEDTEEDVSVEQEVADEVKTTESEVSEKQAPYAEVTEGEDAWVESEPVEKEASQESRNSGQPTVTQVVEETREVAVEQPAEPEQQQKPSRPLTLNEIIQQQKKEGGANARQFQTTAQSERILDLKTAVSLNDKLLFIKDLFNGYSLAYSEAIELLNRFDNFAEADVFLQTNYALKNNWTAKPQTVEKLYAILRKKFI